MKYKGNTVSKPVTGREAETLSKALSTGSYVSNEQAWNTILRIAEKVKKEKSAAK